MKVGPSMYLFLITELTYSIGDIKLVKSRTEINTQAKCLIFVRGFELNSYFLKSNNTQRKEILVLS